MQLLSAFLGEFLLHTFIHCNHIPGRVELDAYELDNHKSRHVQDAFHFEGTSPCLWARQCKYNRLLSSSMLTKVYRVRTLFQKQISRTFPGLFHYSDWFFQDSKIHINRFTPKISMLILLTVRHTFHIFLLEFNRFPGPVALFQDFPVLENATVKFQDFPGFPGPVQTLSLSPKWKGYPMQILKVKLKICQSCALTSLKL